MDSIFFVDTKVAPNMHWMGPQQAMPMPDQRLEQRIEPLQEAVAQVPHIFLYVGRVGVCFLAWARKFESFFESYHRMWVIEVYVQDVILTINKNNCFSCVASRSGGACDH